MYRALRYFLRKFYFTLAVVVIVFAVLVQSGRAFSYLAAEYKEELALYLSEKINGQVQIGSLKAEWDDLQPVLEVSSIAIADPENIEYISIDNIWLRLDLLATLLQRELVWGNFTLEGSEVALDQDAHGQWSLRGAHIFARDKETADDEKNADGLLDALLAAKKVAFENTKVQLQFKDEEVLAVGSPSILLENKGDFHRLLLSVDADAQNNTLFFVAEGTGDPRDENFESEAYLQFREFPISKFSSAVTALFSETTRPHLALNNGVVDGAIWFVNESSAGGYGVVGSLALSGVYLHEQPTSEHLTQLKPLQLKLKTQLSGQINSFKQWHMNLQNLHSTIGDVNLDPTDISVSRALSRASVKVKVSALEAQQLSSLLLSNNFFSPKGTLVRVITDLNAAGRLTNILLDIPLEIPSAWTLLSNVVDVSVESWGHVPAFSHVSGYLSASQFHGALDIDSPNEFSMSFKDVYEEPLRFSSAAGQVAWHLLPEKNRVYVNSGKLHLTDNTESAQGEFLLSLPWRKNTADVDLTIALKAENVQVTQQKKYVPVIVHENIRQWLDASIGTKNTGIASALGFIFRGTVSTREFIDKNVQLSLALTDSELQYHPQWPAVSKVNADLLLDNTEVFSVIHSGSLYNTEVTQAVLSITENPEDDGPLLHLVGSVDGIASDGLRILRESMLQKYIGNAMDSWYLHGQMQGTIDIAVPLSANKKGSYQNVAFSVDAPSFLLDNLNLEFSDLTGSLTYHTDTGLRSDTLKASLFGHPVEVSIGGNSITPSKTGIDVAGVVSSDDLAIWTKRPEVLFLEGDIAYDAHIEVNHHSPANVKASHEVKSLGGVETQDKLLAAISVKSSLEGVDVNLPAPFFKNKNSARDFSLNYILGDDSTLIDIHYSDLLTSVMHFNTKSGQLLSGSVGLGVKATLPTSPALHIEGEMLTFDFQRWQDVLAVYKEKQSLLLSKQTPKGESLSVPITTDIMIAEQSIGPMSLTDLRVRTRQMPNSWDFLLSNEQLLGELNFPSDTALPVTVAMEFLSIQKSWITSEVDSIDDEGLSESVDFSTLRDMNFSVKKLSLGDKDYGRWTFDVKSEGNELLVNNIEGVVRDLTITGDQGANIRWNNDTNLTRFTANILADDLALALEKWQQPARITSESARFEVDLQWPGSPQKFSMLTAAGDIGAVVNRGKFIRQSGSTGEGLLRLMGLFNFDTLARRLRLDFSDLSGGGLAFDQITGQLVLERGLLHISEPIVLDGASSRMQLTGDIDITNETLDTQLVATLPLAGNLTVVAALAAGLPAAAGVWIVSKLFEKQVSKMTSVSYSITGSWNEPVSQFDKIAEVKNQNKSEVKARETDEESLGAEPSFH